MNPLALARDGWAILTGNLWRALACVMLGVILWLMAQIHGVPIVGGLLGLQGWKPRALAAEQTVADIRKAQDDAARVQAEVNAEPARKSAVIAEVTNATADLYLDSVRRAGADRVQPAPRCAGGAAGLPGAYRAAVGDVEDARPAGVVSDASPDSSGEDFVTVDRTEWEQILAAAGQAAMCARAGQALIAAGVAVGQGQGAAREP